MKSMMKRTTIREIKHSFGRYFAILAIVALGVGFFAGLKITKRAMTVSANEYLKDGQLFDYRLLSTLGFEDADVKTIGEKRDVRYAEGAFSADIIYVNKQGNEVVLKAHSLTNHINQLKLTAGRMPENEEECVVDDNYFTEDMIGEKITFSENNDDDSLDKFKEKTYIITGIVRSPYYIQFERGNSSIGNGKISGFFYIKPECFNMDYYTEVFVKFDEDEFIYSDSYKEYMDAKEEEWENYCEQAGDRRYESIMEEANQKVSDAKDELDEQKQKAEKELSDADNELKDGEDEIASGEQELIKAEKDLKKQKEKIEEKEKELQVSKENLENQLTYVSMMGPLPQEEAMKFEIAKQQIEQGLLTIKDAKAKIKDGEDEILEKKKEIEDAKEELANGRKDYDDAKQEFDKKIAEAQTKIDDAEDEIAEIDKPDTYVLTRDTNVGYVCFENDSNIVDGIANVFPVFFFLVAALVCMTTMNRMVEEQRTQIGVLKALGYGNAAIMSKYLFYSGSAAVVGCIIGYLLGTWLFPLVIWNTYGIMYNMCELTFVFDFNLIWISLLVSVLCSMGTTWFSIRLIQEEESASLMRPKSPKAGKRVFLEYVPFIWKKLKFLQKVSVRNIVRYKKRFYMMILGISGCTALLVTGFGIRDSIANVAIQQFDEIETYDLSITLQDGKQSSNIDEMKNITDILDSHHSEYMFISQNTMDLIKNDKIKSTNVIIAEQPERISQFLNLHTKDNKPIPYPEKDEAVICDKLARDYNIKIGDCIVLRDSDMQEMKLTVTAISENYVYSYVYVNEQSYIDQIGNEEYKSIYAVLPENEDSHQLSAKLMKQDNVTGVSVIADMMVRFSSMMNSLNYIVLVVLLCAAALAFIVLYNLNNINITERIREIATIKVLGFYRNETASYVFRENMVLTGAGCLIGLILGNFLHSYVMNEIKIDVVSFDIHVANLSYLFSIALTFLFAIIVNRIMTIKLDKINMAESLKSVD